MRARTSTSRLPDLARRAAAVIAVATAAVAVGSTAAGASAAPPIGLSITLTDGVRQVHSDVSVTYRATLTNTGPATYSGWLVLSVPEYAMIGRHHSTAWHVSVAAGQSVIRSARAHIGTIDKGELRVTAVASVYRGSAGQSTDAPVIRSADADRIAGVADLARPVVHTVVSAAPQPSASSSASQPNPWLLAGTPVVALLAIGLVWVVWQVRRRPRHRPAHLRAGHEDAIDMRVFANR